MIIVVAMAVGGFYALIPAVMKVTRGVNEVIATIMLNYIAINLAAFLVRGPFTGERASSPPHAHAAPVGLVPQPQLVFEMFGLPTGGGRACLLLAIVLGVVLWVVLERTRFGFDVKASGLNASAALASGVGAKKMVISAMVLSGAIAGLIGMPEILGDKHSYGSNFTPGWASWASPWRCSAATTRWHRGRGAAVRLPGRRRGPLQFADVPLGHHDHAGHDRAAVVIANEITGARAAARGSGGPLRSSAGTLPPRWRHEHDHDQPRVRRSLRLHSACRRRYSWSSSLMALSVVRVVSGTDDITSSGHVRAAVTLAVPIGLAGLGGLWSERAGVVNIGLEGMMVLGTWFAGFVGYQWGPWPRAGGILSARSAG